MRRLALLASTLALLGPAPPAGAAVIADLGDFETGAAPGWQQDRWVLSDESYWTLSSSLTQSPVTGSAI